MDINENLSQINTFTGGMNTDTSDMYLKPEEYRFAKNLRLTTNQDSDSGELHLIEGVENNVLFHDAFSEVYATASVRNYGIIIGRLKPDTRWGIYRFDNNKVDDGLKLVFGPCDEVLTNKKLSLVTRWESDNNIKLYIADGNHELMSCFIDDEHISNKENIPTKIDDITSTRTAVLPQPEYTILNGFGQLDAPVIQYSYVLYKTGSGETENAPLSSPIVLYKTGFLGLSYEGYKSGELVLSSVVISIDLSEMKNVDKIRLYRISYVKNGQLPTISIIYDDKFSNAFTYTDSGSVIEQISVAEFISQTKNRIKPLLIESKNDYLFSAGILYVQDDIDALFDKYDLENGKGYVDITIEREPVEMHIGNKGFTGEQCSLMPGERYRYGIILYDNLGRKSSVYYVDDLTVPNETYFKRNVNGSGSYLSSYSFTMYRYYVKAVVRNIENCSGYEIVRCKRGIEDSKTLFLGIVGFPYFKTASSSSVAYYNNIFTHKQMHDSHSQAYGLLLQFACPEYAYQPDDVKNILKDKQVYVDIINEYTVDVEKIGTYENSYQLSFEMVRLGITDTGGLYTFASTGLGQHDEPYKSYTDHRHYLSFGYASISYKIHLAIILPKESVLPFDVISDSVGTDTIEYLTSPSPTGFSDKENLTFINDAYSIRNYNFTNWLCSIPPEDLQNDKDSYEDYYTASGGKCLLIPTTLTTEPPKDLNNCANISVANIKHNIYQPYGGKFGIDNSVYYLFGDYCKYEAGTDNAIEIYSGDVYTTLFLYNSSHAWVSTVYKTRISPTIYIVPLYSTIRLSATYGSLYWNMTNTNKFMFLDEGPVKIGDYTQSDPAYLYNTVYNFIPNITTSTSIKRNEIYNVNFDYRVAYSNLKTNGELIDNWLLFPAALFLDVDTRYGKITDMKLFKNNLMYWQEHATGVLSVNERTIIQSQDESNIILGNGDVLQRYDYLTTKYGMADKDVATTQSNDVLYWWDSINRKILAYAGGLLIVELSNNKNISNYINTTQNKQSPALEYDMKNKEVLFDVVDGGPVVYNENAQKFTSVYQVPFEHSISFQDRLYFIRSNKIYTRNNSRDRILQAIGTDGNLLLPYIKYVVNKQSAVNKVFDTITFGGRMYGGNDLSSVLFTFNTPLKQESRITNGAGITNIEYDFRASVPRSGESDYGNRMRGKTMQCEMSSTSNSTDFSLQYITTKFRISWG